MIAEIKRLTSYLQDRAVWGSDHANYKRAIDGYYKALEELGGKTGEEVTLDRIKRLLSAKTSKLKADHIVFGIPFNNPRYHHQVERFQRASALTSPHDFDVVIDWLNQERLHTLENLLAWEPERMEHVISGNGLTLDGMGPLFYGKDRLTLDETKIPLNARIYFATKVAISLLTDLRPGNIQGLRGLGEQEQVVPEQIQVLEQTLRPLLRRS